MASSPESWVLRFTRTERLVHWVQAASFLVLLATGFIIGFSQLEALFGHRSLMRELHLMSAFVFVFGPSLVALAGNRRAVAEDVREVDEWSRADAAWLLEPNLEPRGSSPRVGRFNAGQKLNAIFTLYATFAFGLTGFIIWQNRRFPFSVVSQANTIHTLLAYLALAVFLGHVYLAAISRATRPSLHGMALGTVRRAWAERHHPDWRYPSAPEGPLDGSTLVRSAILLLLGLEVALLLTRTLLEWIGANPTDALTVLIYHLSALPGTVGHHASGVSARDFAALLWAGLIAAVWTALRRRETLLPQALPAARSRHA